MEKCTSSNPQAVLYIHYIYEEKSLPGGLFPETIFLVFPINPRARAVIDEIHEHLRLMKGIWKRKESRGRGMLCVIVQYSSSTVGSSKKVRTVNHHTASGHLASVIPTILLCIQQSCGP